MWALVTNGSVKIIKPVAQTIGGIQHPKGIFTKAWTDAERQAIGVYKVEETGSHKSKDTHDNHTSQPSYDTDLDQVIIVKSSTPKTDIEPLREKMVSEVKARVSGILSQSDWYIIREVEGHKNAKAPIKNFRKAIRDKGDALEVLILAATTFDDLTSLKENTMADDVQVLGVFNDWPELEDFEDVIP